MTSSSNTRSAALFILVLCVQSAEIFSQTPSTASLTVRDIMSEPSIAGMRPEGAKISPDGEWVAYLWSAKGKEPRDLYLLSTQGGAPQVVERAIDTPEEASPEKTESKDKTESKGESRAGEKKEERATQRDAVQDAQERNVTGIEWSPDSRILLFTKGGDLYTYESISSTDDQPRRLTRTVAVEGSARWLPDSHRIVYQTGGNLFVMNVYQPSFVQLTREGGAAANRRANEGSTQQSGAGTSVSGALPSDDSARIAYIVSDTSKQRALFVPKYTGEFVTAPTVPRGWTDQRIQIVNSDGTSEQAVTIKLPPQEGVSYIRGMRWMPDNASLVIDRIDRDTKRRQLFLADVKNGSAMLIDEEIDAKWVASLSRIVEVSPKGDQLLFASERDGFNHLYLKTLPRKDDATPNAPSDLKQLTRGAWEVDWAKWLRNGERIIYSSTEESTTERHLYILDVKTNKAERLPTARGMNTELQLPKGGSKLLFEHSEWNVPGDLYTIPILLRWETSRVPRRLTDTIPASFKQINWTQPQFIEYKAKDGKSVKARVYTPPNFDKKKKYPAVVFVHGAGYLQNVINGWNNYYREAMFNHILTQRGYVVLDIDYRGSAGYGREWRTDVHDFLGGLDFQDHLDGIDFIVKNFAVDSTRVGMYGGSYGGFMGEMAVMRAPEKVACAAALRPVADWKNYFASSPVYTTERLGIPDKNPEGYKRSSPITYAEGLRSPLLILHGMVDDNVHFQDSAQLIEKLIKLGKSEYFETMFYPTENHSFTKPESWTDEYERILRFFEKHLRPEGATRK